MKLWDDWHDHYYLELLDGYLNNLPLPSKPFSEMNEKELNLWLSRLSSTDDECRKEQRFKIIVQPKQELCSNSQSTKTNVVHLPLSLEDNSTLHGTAAIFEEFGREFSIPCPHKSTIQFCVIEKKFDLHSARTQYDFMKSVNAHHKEMSDMENMMTSNEKQIGYIYNG